METSPSIAALAKALAAFQGEATNPPKTRTAEVGKYRYNYADLSDIITAVKANLRKHGLSVVQSAVSDGNGIGVQTMLAHDSGEWIKSDPLILPLQAATPQAAGSAVTYARRYALSAILGISTEEDDDAGIAQDHQQNRPASRPQAAPPAAPQSAPQSTAPTGDFATEKQRKYMFKLAEERDLDITTLGEYVTRTYGVVKSSELTKRQMSELIDGITTGRVGAELAMMVAQDMGTEVADEGAAQ